MQEQFPPLQEFSLQHWTSFSDFAKDINQKHTSNSIYLEGEGAIHLQSLINNFLFQDVFHLFMMNHELYASVVKEHRVTKKSYFDGVYAYDLSLLNSETFKEAMINPSTKFRKLEANVGIELKSYDYHDEHKLLFSRLEKIDLLFSHQLILNEEDGSSHIKTQIFPSLKQAVQWQKMVEQVNQRTEKFLAEKNKNEK